jgi:hypothetical protein
MESRRPKEVFERSELSFTGGVRSTIRPNNFPFDVPLFTKIGKESGLFRE